MFHTLLGVSLVPGNFMKSKNVRITHERLHEGEMTACNIHANKLKFDVEIVMWKIRLSWSGL